ncbi:MAG: EAL domain-containing protein [Christensenellales bacterium]|jgi:EAL domain-containing protein (putative c-di-GMP-specific phosphodiesterase class I)/GGDEF domain-containing protein
MDFIRSLPSETAILFLVLISLGIIGLTVFLVLKTLKARSVTITEKGENGMLLISAMDKVLEEKISKRIGRQSFTLFDIEIEGAAEIKKSYGAFQFDNAVKALFARIKGIFAPTAKIATDMEGKIRIFTAQKLNLMAINDICKLLLFEIKKPIKLVGHMRVDIAANVGVARYPESGRTYKEITDNLTLALEISKRDGVDKYLIYDKALGSTDSEEYKRYREIKDAIAKKEFLLYYQPMINVETGEVFGVEALLRWEHREKGVLPPSEFLRVMEQSGDINWVGLWAFEELIKNAEKMKLKIPDNPLLYTMNLSAKQLIYPTLAEELRRILKRHRVSPLEFCLEISEYALYQDNAIANNNIADLKKIGFNIALDNYGLEFSTLTALDKLPLDIIKLDRRFLEESKNNMMLSNVLDLVVKYSAEKNVTLLAEGVENQEFLDYVKEKGIKNAQGYLFSRPVSKKQIINIVLFTPWK